MRLLLNFCFAASLLLLIWRPAAAADEGEVVRLLAAQGHFDRALKKLEPLLAAKQGDEQLLMLKMRILRALDRWSDVAKVMQKLKTIKLSSETSLQCAILNLEVMQHTGRAREIAQACDRATRDFPRQANRFAISKVWGYALCSERENAYKYLVKINAAALSKEEQQKVLAWYARLGKIPETLKIANLICQNSRNVAHYLIRAQILCLLNRREEALATCAKGLNFDDDVVALRTLNTLSRRLKSSLGMVSDLVDRQVLIFPSIEVNRLNLKALRLQSQGDYRPSLKDLDVAVKLEPWNLQTLILRSIALQQNELFKEALAELNTALLWSPGYSEVYKARAEIYFKMEDFKAELANRIIYADLHPHDFFAQKQCAECYLKCQQPAKALTRVNLAQSLHMPEEYLGEVKGQALLALKKPDAVVSYLTPILKLDLSKENRMAMLAERAKAYKLLGSLELARKDEAKVSELQQAIFLNPNPHGAAGR